MKILMYGFKPYGKYSENISEKIVKRFSNLKNIKTVIFPVVFDEKIFLSAIKKYQPDIILGLGQCPRGKKIRIERHAKRVNLKLTPNRNSRLSYDAGNFVCDFSMKVIGSYSFKQKIKFAFIHIPKDFNLKKAVQFINNKLDEVLKTSI